MPRTLSSYGDRSFAAAGPRLWNSLPVQLRNLDITYTDCSDDSWRVIFFGKHEHGALWLLTCGCLEKHLLTYLLSTVSPLEAFSFVTRPVVTLNGLQLCDGAAVAQRVERSTDRGFKPFPLAKLRNNLGQVVYTYVTLSPSSINWYWPRGGDALRLGR